MKVNVATYRQQVRHLERLVHVDRHSCVDAQERANWADVTRRIRGEVAALECARAKAEDRDAHAKALEAAAVHLGE